MVFMSCISCLPVAALGHVSHMMSHDSACMVLIVYGLDMSTFP